MDPREITSEMIRDWQPTCVNCYKQDASVVERYETGDKLCPQCLAAEIVDEMKTEDETTLNGWTIKRATDPWVKEYLGHDWQAIKDGHFESGKDLYDLIIGISESL